MKLNSALGLACLAVLMTGCQHVYKDYPEYRTERQVELIGREQGDEPVDLHDGKSWHVWRLDSSQCLLDELGAKSAAGGRSEGIVVLRTLFFDSDNEETGDSKFNSYVQEQLNKNKPSPNPIEKYRADRALQLGAASGQFLTPSAEGHFYAWQMPDGTYTVDSVSNDGKGGVVVDTSASASVPNLDAAYTAAGGAMTPNQLDYIQARSAELGATLDWGELHRFWLLLGFKKRGGGYTLDFLKADTSKGVERLRSQDFDSLNALALWVDQNGVKQDAAWADNLQYRSNGWILIGVVLLVVASVLFNIGRAKGAKGVTIRRINGLDQIDEAVGRATETARPVLMVPGLSAQLDGIAVQALTVFAYVVRSAARFRTPIRLLNYNPAVYAVATEIVRDVYLSEGVPEQFDPDSVRFVTDRQFAFAAAVAGLIQREKVAAAFMMGDFYAESLIFAENANLVGAIQVAATTQFTQTPFFIAACDYVLLGDEFYAASAYLGRQPVLLGSMVGIDWAKMMFMAFVVFAVIVHSYQMTQKVDLSKLPPETRANYERLHQVYPDPNKDELFFVKMTKMKRF